MTPIRKPWKNTTLLTATSDEFTAQTRQYTGSLYSNLQPKKKADKIIKDIKEQAFHQINANLSKADFEQAAQAFKEFLTLPQEIKDRFTAAIDERRWSNCGYVRKEREQGDTDNKQYFHYNLYTEQRLWDMIKQHPEAKKFIIVARKIYLSSLAQIATLLKKREAKYPGIYNHFINKSKDPYFYVRFLSYEINPEDDTDKDRSAKGHYDIGSMTIAHAESHPWLRIGHTDTDIQEVIHKDGKAKYFLSAYFPRMIIKHRPETLSSEQQELLAQWQKKEVINQLEKERCGWHDVMQQKTNTPQQRRAIVSFFDWMHQEEISYADAHTAAK